MLEDALKSIIAKREQSTMRFEHLMPRRIRNVLLVSSLYDSFTFEQDGRLSEALFSDYLELNLRFAPHIDRVPTAQKALERLKLQPYDLIVSMLRVGSINPDDFGRSAKAIQPGIPVVLLAFGARELSLFHSSDDLSSIEQIFMWNGDVRLFLAIIKNVEDKLNAWHDARIAGVQSIILVEDSVNFYSSYLPMLYTEIMEQTRSLMADGANRMQRLLRMHARPKILLANTYEEALSLYNQYQDHLLGTIVDASFPRNGVLDSNAGINFAQMVVSEHPDCAVLMQSSDHKNEKLANDIGVAFINKRSPQLLNELRFFMQSQLGFGDFVFRRPDGSEVTTTSDIKGLVEALKLIPEECLLYHGRRKDFSTWLMARTEFDLAKAIRVKKMSSFATPKEFRKHLIRALKSHKTKSRAGIVADFSSDTSEAGAGFVQIGTGSLGGKGRGLAFFHSLLRDYEIENHIDGFQLFIPPTAVLATDVFDHMTEPFYVKELVLGDASDKEIASAFLAMRLPDHVKESLRSFLVQVQYPLAVRSSSLLEDASYQPLAGIYKTYMIPNNDESLEVRLGQLSTAIKLVYASTFYQEAKAYFESTPNRPEEEKMAVIIQEIVGKNHGDYMYPDIAGVARAHNFYPTGKMKSEDGVVCAVLGFGKSVVEGGRCVRFSPKYPTAIFDISKPREFMVSMPREYWALDLRKTEVETSNKNAQINDLISLNLNTAVSDKTLNNTCSVYSAKDQTIKDGYQHKGVKLITLAGILKDKNIAIGKAFDFLLELGKASFSWPVEIEFALNLAEDDSKLHQLAFLQIRPMVVATTNDDISNISDDEKICVSKQAIGPAQQESVYDIIYVKPESFNRAYTTEIAQQVGDFNDVLKKQGKRYVLIGPGRWGSTDWRLGIPVTWAQISNVACLVETELKGLSVSPSQGSHFFHNITAFGVGCLSVKSTNSEESLDTSWLDAQKSTEETEFIRHLHFDTPIQVLVDSQLGHGIVLKPLNDET